MESDSSFPEGANPFRRHAGCDHDPPKYLIDPLGKGPKFDILKFLALVDAALERGDIRDAREHIWAMGSFLDVVATGNGDAAAAVLEAAQKQVDAEVERELRRMADGE